MKWFPRWAALALVLLLLVGLALLLHQRPSLVQVDLVTRGAIAQSVLVSGRINAAARLELGSEVSATVQEVLAREGDRVRAGAVLVRLSDAEAQAALQQAQALLAEARARASQQVTLNAPLAEQTLRQAQAQAQAVEREHLRVRELVAQGFFSQQRQDDSQRALETARSALAQAQLQVQAQQRNGVESQLARARVQQAEAALALAQARLARLLIKSPMDALVLARHVEPGGMAQPGRALLSLAALGGLRIDVAVDEQHLGLLSLGMPARALADAFPNQPFEATLSHLSPAVDPQRGTLELRLALDPAPAFVRPDMTVSVELLGPSRTQALLLPALALRAADTSSPWVLRVRDGRAERVPVQLGLRGIGMIEVVSGLAEGDLVIAQTEATVPGERVRPRAPAAPAHGLQLPGLVVR